jgi:hypothetical protein
MGKLAFVILLLAAVPAWANDSAASVASGGIVLRREARITMQKERLTNGKDKVIPPQHGQRAMPRRKELECKTN